MAKVQITQVIKNLQTYQEQHPEEPQKVCYNDGEFYSMRSLLGNTWARFYILLGGRCAGKSYAVMSYFLSEWKKKQKPFVWLRLTEAAQKKMLRNNANDAIDADLRRKFKLDITVKGNQIYDKGKPMCRILALSTYYTDKGAALYDKDFDKGYNICLDEMNRENCERKGFDICYAFVNQMENILRKTKTNIRVFLIGNYLNECSDILALFGFIPQNFGRYKLRKKHAILEYIKPSKKYLESRKDTVANTLTPQESTFTNEINVDYTLVDKRRRIKPTMVIKFDKSSDKIYTVWDGKILAPYNNEKVPIISMRPYLDCPFDIDARNNVFQVYHSRGFHYKDLITQLKFSRELSLLKPQG